MIRFTKCFIINGRIFHKNCSKTCRDMILALEKSSNLHLGLNQFRSIQKMKKFLKCVFITLYYNPSNARYLLPIQEQAR